MSLAEELWFSMHHSEDPNRETYAVNCYLDESATDGSTPEAVVAGVLMNRSGFLCLDEAWKGLIDKHNLRPAFHMKDFGLHGKHAGFSATDRSSIFDDAVRIINEFKLYSVAATINHAQYRQYMDTKIREHTSVYCLCFILSAYTNHLRAAHNKYEKNIGFLLDTGNPYAEHVREAHVALKRWQQDRPLNVGSLTFDDDENVTALQAADLVAWSVRRRMTGGAFKNGFEPLLGIFNDHHSEQAWDGTTLQPLSESLNAWFAAP